MDRDLTIDAHTAGVVEIATLKPCYPVSVSVRLEDATVPRYASVAVRCGGRLREHLGTFDGSATTLLPAGPVELTLSAWGAATRTIVEEASRLGREIEGRLLWKRR